MRVQRWHAGSALDVLRPGMGFGNARLLAFVEESFRALLEPRSSTTDAHSLDCQAVMPDLEVVSALMQVAWLVGVFTIHHYSRLYGQSAPVSVGGLVRKECSGRVRNRNRFNFCGLGCVATPLSGSTSLTLSPRQWVPGAARVRRRGRW